MSGVYGFVRGLANVLRGLAANASGALYVEPLGRLGIARDIAVTTSSQAVTLTPTCTRVSVVSDGGKVRIVHGTGATDPTAANDGGSKLLANERIDFEVEPGTRIAVIRDATETATSHSVQVQELMP